MAATGSTTRLSPSPSRCWGAPMRSVPSSWATRSCWAPSSSQASTSPWIPSGNASCRTWGPGSNCCFGADSHASGCRGDTTMPGIKALRFGLILGIVFLWVSLMSQLDALNRTFKHNHLQQEQALKELQQCVDENERRMDVFPQILDEHARRMERYEGGLMEVWTMAGTPEQERSDFL